MSDDDALVAAYLGRLVMAARQLPADRRAELIDEISEHIAEARAIGADTQGSLRELLQRLGEPDDIVRAAMDSPGYDLALASVGAIGPIGLPAAAAAYHDAAAESGADGRPGTPGQVGVTGQPEEANEPSSPGRAAVPSTLPFMEIAAVVLALGSVLLLLINPLLALACWAVGVVLLWISPCWRAGDKLLATLVAPALVFGVTLVRFLASWLPGAYPSGFLFASASSGLGWSGVFSLLRLVLLATAVVVITLVAIRLLRRVGLRLG